MSSATSLVDSAVELEARRRVAEEQAAARKIALQKQKEREVEKMRLIEAQREDRVRREAEQIQARLRAEEAEREARAKAEAEAFEAAVSAHAEALRKRPLEERLRAEIEELREVIGSLNGELRGVCAAPPPSYGISAIQSQVASLAAASPWNTGISELKAQLSTGVSALQSQLGELRTLSTKPARAVYINASAAMLGSWNPFPQGSHPVSTTPNSPSGARTLEVVYHLIPQGAPEVAAGAQAFLDIPEGTVNSIAVPAGQKLFVARAHWKPHNNVRGGAAVLDVTSQLKALGVEHQ
jgi:hypothetical protein